MPGPACFSQFAFSGPTFVPAFLSSRSAVCRLTVFVLLMGSTRLMRLCTHCTDFFYSPQCCPSRTSSTSEGGGGGLSYGPQCSERFGFSFHMCFLVSHTFFCVIFQQRVLLRTCSLAARSPFAMPIRCQLAVPARPRHSACPCHQLSRTASNLRNHVSRLWPRRSRQLQQHSNQ